MQAGQLDSMHRPSNATTRSNHMAGQTLLHLVAQSPAHPLQGTAPTQRNYSASLPMLPLKP